MAIVKREASALKESSVVASLVLGIAIIT